MVKVFIVTGRGTKGGHNRSAKIIAVELNKRGYDVHIVAGGSIDIYDNVNIPIKKLTTKFYGSHFFSFKTFLEFYNYAKYHKPEIIHAFDAEGLIISYIYSIINKVKLLYTICGGVVSNRFHYINMKPVIVFSEEQKYGADIKGYINKKNIIVCPGRIDLNFNVIENKKYEYYKNLFSINNSNAIVLMINRIHINKYKSLNYFVELANHFVNQEKVQFLNIGMIQNKNLMEVVSRKVDMINKNAGFNLINFTEEGSDEARRYLPIADIVVACGRTAYEAMSKGKPTLIMGEYGFAGLAYGELCREHAKYNFSGRNIKDDVDATQSIKEAKNIILKLLNNKEFYRKVSEYSEVWVNNNVDVRCSGETYDYLYKKSNKFIYPNITNMAMVYLYHTLKKYYYMIKYYFSNINRIN